MVEDPHVCRGRNYTTYSREDDFNSIEDCDKNVNKKEYKPGPSSVMLSIHYKQPIKPTRTTKKPLVKVEQDIDPVTLSRRPLYNPDKSSFAVLKFVADAKKEVSLQSARLSDYVVVVLAIAIKEKVLKRSDVQIFETVYADGAKLRGFRTHDGLPGLAPDNTPLGIKDEEGNIVASHGCLLQFLLGSPNRSTEAEWNIDDIHHFEDYSEWRDILLVTEKEFIARGVDPHMINTPLPDPNQWEGCEED
jgi:hypothetical protein